MSIPTVTVIGTAVPPSDVAVAGSIRFILSGFDLDGETGVIVPREVSGPIGIDGGFVIQLWPNTNGVNSSTYTAYVTLPRPIPGAGSFDTVLGTFALTDVADIQTIVEVLTETAPSASPAALQLFDAAVTVNNNGFHGGKGVAEL